MMASMVIGSCDSCKIASFMYRDDNDNSSKIHNDIDNEDNGTGKRGLPFSWYGVVA